MGVRGQRSLGRRWDGGIYRDLMAGRISIDVTKDSAKKGAVVKTVMNPQAISLPVAELSACRRDSCCLQLVSLSVSELNHVFRGEN